MPGVERPCDTEEPVEVTVTGLRFDPEQKLLEAAHAWEDHRKGRNHATDTDPNEGSFKYPAVRFCWHATGRHWRVHLSHDKMIDIPVTRREMVNVMKSQMDCLHNKAK